MTAKRLMWAILSALLIYFCLNYSWSHAALAGALSGTKCAGEIAKKAQEALVPLFGEVTAAPWIYCLNGPAAGLKVSHGTTRFAPLLPSIIVLGPRGQNVDVASHEYAHAELAKRTSVLLRSYRIPTWFDEGLAMQVDHRAEYSSDALQDMLRSDQGVAVRLADISSPSRFFGHGERSVMHYAFARCVLGQAISERGVAWIGQTAKDVSWISHFPSADFEVFEQACNRVNQATR